MAKRQILLGLAVSVTLAACGQGAATASDAEGAATPAADQPVFTEATLEALRQAPGQAVRESLQFAQEECGSAPLGFAPGGIRTADLNADGRPDYLVDMTTMMCGDESRGSGWCGSLGCSFDIFVSNGAEYHQDSYIGMEPQIVRRGEGLAVAAVGRDGPWMVAWSGSRMDIVERMDGAAVEPTETSGGDEEAVRAVAASIYDAYAAGFDSGVSVPDGVETAEFRRVIDAAIDPDMGGLEFDFYCACQDYDQVTYDLSGVAVTGDRATVAVDFRSYGQLTQIELRMRKVAGRWQVDDVIDPNGSVRAQLGGS